MKKIKIADYTLEEFSQPFVIAEIGANNNGDSEIAKEMVLKAKEAGVHCAKFQSWTKESIFSKAMYSGKEAELTVFGHKTQGDLLDYLSMSEKDHFMYKEFCDKHDILFSTTPISFRHVDLMADLDVPFYKVASMDVNHPLFIEYIAKKGKPVILSTGMSSLEETALAVEAVLNTGNEQLILLHCTALYPPDDAEVNLNNIDMLRSVFGVQIGYSDHTTGYSIPLAAITKGVSVIEKHYTLDKTMPGWDHAVSATPEEFKIIVDESQRIVKALGSNVKAIQPREENSRKNMRRSIVASMDLVAGHVLSQADLDFKRPGTGIEPKDWKKLINRKLTKNISADSLFSWSDVE